MSGSFHETFFVWYSIPFGNTSTFINVEVFPKGIEYHKKGFKCYIALMPGKLFISSERFLFLYFLP